MPYKPNVTRTASAGLLFGVMAGIAFAVLRERADRTLQDPGDVAYYLGVPELGVIPIGTQPTRRRGSGAAGWRLTPQTGKDGAGRAGAVSRQTASR